MQTMNKSAASNYLKHTVGKNLAVQGFRSGEEVHYSKLAHDVGDQINRSSLSETSMFEISECGSSVNLILADEKKFILLGYYQDTFNDNGWGVLPSHCTPYCSGYFREFLGALRACEDLLKGS